MDFWSAVVTLSVAVAEVVAVAVAVKLYLNCVETPREQGWPNIFTSHNT